MVLFYLFAINSILFSFIQAFAHNGTVYVISRCNEDINWLIPIASQTIILNKCAPLDQVISKVFLDVKQLPNVGRESHSYLDFVLSNYDDLPDEVVFSQARINDHEGYKTGGSDILVRLGDEARTFGKSLNFSPPCTKRIFHIGFDLRRCFPNLTSQGENTLSKWMVKYFGEYSELNMIYWYGIFAVRKDLILKRSKESYQTLISTVNYSINPLEGFYFERTWALVFNLI